MRLAPKLAAIPVWRLASLLLAGALFTAAPAVAQDDIDAVEISFDAQEPLRLSRYDHAVAGIKIDGRLDETPWLESIAHTELRVIRPDTLAVPPHRTSIRLFYTERGVYVSFDMEQPKETLLRRFTARDNAQARRDAVSFTLDTSGGGRYGYWMNLALGDNQSDGTVLPERQFKRDWDGAWYGATAITDKGWSAEFFVPWSQMAMPSERRVRRMGFYGSRNVGYLNERWAWPALPDSLPRFMSALQPIELEGINPRQQWSLFPYIASTTDQVDSDTDVKVGAEVFWRPSSNFQLTGSLNPDFGAAEADDVDVNLTANETFFPERRLFFLEGREVFDATPRAQPRRGGGAGGGDNIFTLINTRRIGGRPRSPDLPDGIALSDREKLKVADLLGAVKATGQLGAFRYGVLASIEDDTQFTADDGMRYISEGRDFAAVRLIYEDSKGAAYRGLGFLSTGVLHPESDAIAHSADIHYLSTNGRWRLDGQAVYSDVDDVGQGTGGFSDITYTPRQGLKHTLQLAYFDDKLEVNDFGFNQRNDLKDLRYRMEWQKSGLDKVRNFTFSPFIRYAENTTEGKQVSGAYAGSFNVTLNSLDEVSFFAGYFPERFDDQNSFGNGTFRINERSRFRVGYATNEADVFSFEAEVEFEDEWIEGRQLQYSAGVTWQPRSNFSMEVKAGYTERDGWILHQDDQDFTSFLGERWAPELKIEFFPNAKQQLQLSLQWLGIRGEEDKFYTLPDDSFDLVEGPKPPGDDDSFSISQLNLQLRYRWQIAPLSDLFVVYQRGDRTRDEFIDFDDLFRNSWNDPLGEIFLVKLRYRLGS